MTPLTQDPRLVLLLNPDTGAPVKASTNVSDELAIKTTVDPKEFDELARGNPFTITQF